MRGGCLGGRWLRLAGGGRDGLAANASKRPADRVVGARDDALLERDDAVVGDMDVLGAHIGAAFRDVAVGEPVLRADELGAVVRVERVHLERREADEEARTREAVLVVLVIADDVTHVLAEEALDAFVELLYALDVLLIHPARAVGLHWLR